MIVSRIIALLIVVALGVLAWHVFRPAEEEETVEPMPTEVAVQVGTLVRRTLHRYVAVYGIVEPEPAAGGKPGAGARLMPAVPGLVTEIVCREGQRVEQGQVLVRLDSRATDVQVRRAREQAAYAEAQYERQEKLLQVEGTSQKTLQDAEQVLRSAKSELDAALTQHGFQEIQAPIAGIVARIAVRPGEAVDLATTLVELVDPDRLVIAAHVPAGELEGLAAGSPIELLESGTRGPALGAVLFVSPQIDPATGSASIRASVPAGAALRPGQYVELRIVSEERRDRLAAPAESIVRNEDGETVIALIEADRAVQKPVRAGLRDGGWIEVEGDGIQEGATVVTVGAYGLPRDTTVRVVGGQ